MRAKGFDIDLMRANGINPSNLLGGGLSFAVPKMFLKMGCDIELLLMGILSQLGLDSLIGSSGDTGGSALAAVFQLSKIFDRYENCD